MLKEVNEENGFAFCLFYVPFVPFRGQFKFDNACH